ncbi:MAG: WD40 repeat domain-containing serine/threonine protein kinase, partial [Opitutaceae bacterium]
MQSAPHIADLTLLRRIGRGSYGEVWIARTLTGVYRAVKIVHRARFEDDRPFLRELDGITRFQRSAGRQTRQLALMHVGRDDANGFFYYVMELADDVARGTDIDPDTYEPYTLKSLREREVLLPAVETVRLGVELARALAGLHEAGLIHRDVKPSNIILVAGAPKLADIGLVSSGDHTLTSLGTPGYSPPEGAGTIRADIFSLGRILYELSTGRGPDEFPKLPKDLSSRKDVAVLLELNEVVLRACDPDPKKRYASVKEMLEDLLLIQAGKSVKELVAIRRRLKSLGKAAGIVGAAAAVVIAVLGVKNYFAVKALAAQESEARVQAENDERLARYTSDLHLAQLALSGGNLGQARAALRRQIPGTGETIDLRGLEWHLLWGEAQGDDARAFGTPGGPPVLDIALSPDGRQLAAQEGEEVRTTVLWNLDAGGRRALAENTFGLGGFSSDGNALFAGTTENTLQRIELASGEATVIPGAEGRLLARADDAPRVLLGVRTGNGFEFRVFDLDAQQVAGVWAVERGETRLSLSEQVLSPDGTRMAVAIFWENGSD